MTSSHTEPAGAVHRGPVGECACAGSRRPLLLIALVVLAPFGAAALRTIDSRTSAFIGLLPFRIRIVGGLALLALLIVTAIASAGQRHRIADADGAPQFHYLYSRRARRGLRIGAAVAAAALCLSLFDLRYFRNTPGPVRLRVSAAEGLPAPDVTIDLLDLDRRPITRAPAVTDAFGVATLHVLDGRGLPVFLSTGSRDGRCDAITRLPLPGVLRRLTRSAWERSQSASTLAIACPAGAAVVMPFTPPPTSGIHVPPVASGPWPADPWMVDVMLRTRPPVAPSEVTVTVLAPEGASAHRQDPPTGEAVHWMVRPPAHSRERPTYVTLLAAAPGQKPVRLHLGPLTFVPRQSSGAAAGAGSTSAAPAGEIAGVETSIPFEPDLIPAIAQVSRVLPEPGEAAALDVSVSNPLDRAAAITRVVLQAAQPRPPLTKCSGGMETYGVSLTVSVRDRRSSPGGMPRRFPVHGTLSRFCGATEMQAAIAFAQELPPRQSSILQFVVHEGVKRNRDSLAPLGPVLNDREYDWTLRLEIDRELVITGDYHPPRALFGR
jgi:hypothetical protein